MRRPIGRVKETICGRCLKALGLEEPRLWREHVRVPILNVRPSLVEGDCDFCALFEEHPPVKARG